MRLTKSLLAVISALALVTGPAFADEQFSLIEPGTGQELMGSHEVTSEGDVISSEQFSPMNDREALGYEERDWLSESDRFALSEPDMINEGSSMSESDPLALSEPDVIYEEETIVSTPSVDNETPRG